MEISLKKYYTSTSERSSSRLGTIIDRIGSIENLFTVELSDSIVVPELGEFSFLRCYRDSSLQVYDLGYIIRSHNCSFYIGIDEVRNASGPPMAYSNPATNTIHINQLPDPYFKRCVIFNAYGQLTDDIQLKNVNKRNELNAEIYPPGIYPIELIIENDLSSYRITKN